MSALGQKQTSAHVRVMFRLTPNSGHHKARFRKLTSWPVAPIDFKPDRRASAMGFNRRKVEDRRRQAAEKEAASRYADGAGDFYDGNREPYQMAT